MICLNSALPECSNDLPIGRTALTGLTI
jgi:hypothetical protein